MISRIPLPTLPTLLLCSALGLATLPGSATAEEATAPAAVPAAPAAAAPAAAAEAAEAAAAQAAPAGQLTPDQVVAAYLKAMQDHRFADAYKQVSSTLRAGKGVEEWSKEQQYIMDMGEVKIIEFKVYPAIIGADGIARVPNILKSQDKFLNQLGLDEHELYELIKEDGGWRIDQQTLAEGPDREEYFPEESATK